MALPMNREEAFALLKQHTKTPSLIKHALCVEAAMEHFAQLFEEDVSYWGMVGLLHDLDYEEYPEEHCDHCPEMLRNVGFDESFIRSVLSHAYGHRNNICPEHLMEKVIYTVDELTGLITAAVLMRPDKNIANQETKSVKKKFKQASFAAAIDRELIQNGCDMLGMELDQVITHCITALQKIAPQLELDGSLVE